MKKLLMLILCLSMAFGSVALAAEKELNKNVLQGTTNVSMTIDHDENSFVVVIPASVSIDPETKTGAFDVVLKAGWKLLSSNGLSVKIEGFANGPKSSYDYSDRDVFTLKNSDGKTARYMVYPKVAGATKYDVALHNYGGITSGSHWSTIKLIDVKNTDSNENDQTASLKLEVPVLPKDPGEYTDTITFAVVLN